MDPKELRRIVFWGRCRVAWRAAGREHPLGSRALASVIGVVLVAVTLAATPEVASANPAQPVTTVLQPGFNMAGWIEPEAGVAELFEAVPELEAVYAWDAGAQRYRSNSAQLEGDLTTLTPGMGLWLEIDGDEQVTWTRSGDPDPAAGLTALREGWNLVAWSGSENTAFEDAFATLHGPSQIVLTWDAEAQRFVSYVPGATAGGDHVVRLGGAVWVSSPGERHWLQPGSFEPRVEFYGEFTAARKAEIRAETRSVVTWFAERYGLLEPDFELYVGADRASLDQVRREVLGIQDPAYVLCGVAVNELVFLADWCITATHDLTSPLAHEYFHVLQTHLVALTPTTETAYVAGWLLEGTAEHMAIGYAIAHGDTTAEEVEQALRESVVYNPLDLEALTDISQLDTVGYQTAAFAVQQLVDQTDEAAVLEFFELLPSTDGWEDAFTRAFGRTVSSFYSRFSGLVEGMTPVTQTVTVTTLLPDGTALWEWKGRPLDVHASNSSVSISGSATEDGAQLDLPRGLYSVRVSAVCRVFGGDFYSSAYLDSIGVYSLDGVPITDRASRVLEVADQDLAINVNLAGLPSELKLNCYDGPRFNIEGRVTDASGEPLEGHQVIAYARTHPHDRGFLDLNYTDDDGRFTVPAPDGHTYTLAVWNTCGATIGYYRAGEGLVQWDTSLGLLVGTQIPVDGAAVSGIDMVIPAALDTGDEC